VAGPISISTSPRCHKGGGLLLFKRPVKQEAFIPYSATLFLTEAARSGN
jgi:hypothetical protein